MDLHAAQIQGFFDIPVDNLYAAPVFALDIKHHFKGQHGRSDGHLARCRRCGPCARTGAADRAPLAIVDKRREKAGEVAEMTVIGDVDGQGLYHRRRYRATRPARWSKAAQVLTDARRDRGSRLYHPWRAVRPGGRAGAANSVMKSLVITDSIQPTEAVKNAPNIRIVPTAPMFAQAILNIWNGTSVSSPV